MEKTHTCSAQSAGRLDRILAQGVPCLSRARIKSLILGGQARLNGVVIKDPSHKVQVEAKLALDIPDLEPAKPIPEAIELTIVFEDAHLIVLNKQPGLTVHPGAGQKQGTLVNALLHHCGHTLSGIGGIARPGIVHRLDKNTSGLMLVAKTDVAHKSLATQLEAHTIVREYMTLVLGPVSLPSGTIDAPIGRDPCHRLRMAVRKSGAMGARSARTRWRIEATFGPIALLVCRLETGRTHQIRVHMTHAGWPLIGDPLYGPQPSALISRLMRAKIDPDPFLTFSRQALHARSITFDHPITRQSLTFTACPPEDMLKLLRILKPYVQVER